MTLEEALKALEAEKAAHAKTTAARDEATKAAGEHEKYRRAYAQGYAALKTADPAVWEYAIRAAKGETPEFPRAKPAPGTGRDPADAGAPEDGEVPAWAARLLEAQRAEMDGLKALVTKRFEALDAMRPDVDQLKTRQTIQAVRGKVGAEAWDKYEKAILEKTGGNPALLHDPEFVELLFDGVRAKDAEQHGYDRAKAETQARARHLAGFGPAPTGSRGSADVDLSKLGIDEYLDKLAEDPALVVAEAERRLAPTG